MISKIWKMHFNYTQRLHIFDILTLVKSIYLLFQKIENIHLNPVLHPRGFCLHVC